MDELNKEAKEILQAAAKDGYIIIVRALGCAGQVQAGGIAFGKRSHQMSQNYIDALEDLESAGLVRNLKFSPSSSTYELTREGYKALNEIAGGEQ